MKTTSLRKIVIPGFALLIGGALAASISSTVAWFQYATRAQVAYVGAMSHCSKLLKISVDNGVHWDNDYYQNDMASRIQGNHLLPITTGPQAKDNGLVYHQVDDGNGGAKNIVRFYSQPEYGFGGDYSKWHFASDQNYAQFTILVRVNDVDGRGVNGTPLVDDVYLNKIVIEDDAANGTGSDLSDAVRVHLAVTDANNHNKYLLFSKSVTQTIVGGKLDLNNDGAYDKDLVLWDDSDCIYGTPGERQYSYTVDDTDAVVEDPNNPSANAISLGKTGTGYMKIVVTTWIEGWSKLDHGYSDNVDHGTDTAVWDPAEYVNKKFNVGIRLGVKSHDNDHQ